MPKRKRRKRIHRFTSHAGARIRILFGSLRVVGVGLWRISFEPKKPKRRLRRPNGANTTAIAGSGIIQSARGAYTQPSRQGPKI